MAELCSFLLFNCYLETLRARVGSFFSVVKVVCECLLVLPLELQLASHFGPFSDVFHTSALTQRIKLES